MGINLGEPPRDTVEDLIRLRKELEDQIAPLVARRNDLIARIKAACPHSYVWEESYREEDTLGNGIGKGVTTTLCLLCSATLHSDKSGRGVWSVELPYRKDRIDPRHVFEDRRVHISGAVPHDLRSKLMGELKTQATLIWTQSQLEVWVQEKNKAFEVIGISGSVQFR